MSTHPEDAEQRGDDLAQRLLQRLGDVVDVVGHPAEYLTAGLLVEVAQRQPGQLRLGALPEPKHPALHDGRRKAALQQAERRGREVGQQREE